MLKEISIEELPEKIEFCAGVTPDGQFAQDTMFDFVTSDVMIAEVTGWPSGEPKNGKDTNRYRNLLESKAKKAEFKRFNVGILQRGRRLFLQKTIIRKAGEVDG